MCADAAQEDDSTLARPAGAILIYSKRPPPLPALPKNRQVCHATVLRDYPYLEDEDITAALEFAARATDHPVFAAVELGDFWSMPTKTKRPGFHRASFFSDLRGAYAASSVTISSAASSAGLVRRGPLASAASICLMLSVSVTRSTAAISRASRSSAAS